MNLLLELILGGFLAALGAFLLVRYRKASADMILGIGLLVAALIYVGFALFGLIVATSDSSWLVFEAGGVIFYSAFVYLGIRSSALYLAVGWAMHVLWDALLHSGAAFVPAFYPGVCVGFDIVAALFALYLYFERDAV